MRVCEKEIRMGGEVPLAVTNTAHRGEDWHVGR